MLTIAKSALASFAVFLLACTSIEDPDTFNHICYTFDDGGFTSESLRLIHTDTRSCPLNWISNQAVQVGTIVRDLTAGSFPNAGDAEELVAGTCESFDHDPWDWICYVALSTPAWFDFAWDLNNWQAEPTVSFTTGSTPDWMYVVVHSNGSYGPGSAVIELQYQAIDG